MQGSYVGHGRRSDVDSIINSDFDTNLDHYQELRTESFLGYLRRGRPEERCSIPELPGPLTASVHLPHHTQSRSLSTETPAESQVRYAPKLPEDSPIDPAGLSNVQCPNEESARLPIALTPVSAKTSASTRTPLSARSPMSARDKDDKRSRTQPSVPTATSSYSKCTLGSASGYNREHFPRYMTPEDQPLNIRHINGASDPSYRQRKRLIVYFTLGTFVCVGVILGVVISLLARHKHKRDGFENITKLAVDQKLWGAGGDTITTDKGHKFVYNNTLGGTWVAIPFNDTARPQGNQPALNERWDYSVNRILGVNLGGWLVLEPFITPGLFEPYFHLQNPPVDEWELSQAMGTSLANIVETHYANFITEEDFAQIASAGLNWVRIPVGWWMIETLGKEPFLAGVSWKYFFRAMVWARKYGLRINLDLHSVPGSQNGWNHSGRMGTVGFLAGAMGIANAQRTLNYIRTFTEFISQPEYKNVVPMFSILNEPMTTYITTKALSSWYYQSYKMIRDIGGYGERNGPFVVIHDAFQGIGAGAPAKNIWSGFLSGSDRIGLDTHAYVCFTNQTNDPMPTNAFKPCNLWAARSTQTMENFGLTMSGEWSLAVNDCGLYVNNVGYGERYEGTYPNASQPDPQYPRVGSCETWVDHRTWSEERKKSFADLAQSSQDALINSFFWTWKIGESIKQDHPPNPMWNYKLGLEAGYIRPDARASSGRCSQLAAQLQAPLPAYEWAGTLSTWQTGGLGAGNINQAQLDAVGPFPPLTILGGPPNGLGKYEAAALPQLAPIGPVLTLKPTPIVMGSKNYPAGDGWYNPADVAGYFVPINGCQYLDPWSGFNVPAPTLCNIPAPPAQTPIANPAPAAVVNGQASMPTPAPTRPLR